MKGYLCLWGLLFLGYSLSAQFSTDAVFHKDDSVLYYNASTQERRLVFKSFTDDLEVDFESGRIYLRTPDIVSVDLSGENMEAVSFQNGGSISLDAMNTLFFSDNFNSDILRLNTDQSTSIVLNVGSVSVTGSIIIDFEMDKYDGTRLYLARNDPEEIQIWDLAEDRMINTIQVSGLSRITSVPATNQLFYIANIETDSVKIGVSNLDGNNVRNLISNGLEHPISLTANTAEGKIYWTENGENLAGLYRANFDGSDIEKVSDEIIRHLVFPMPLNTNEAPVVTKAISDLVLPYGFESFQIELDTVFTDPDGDDLNYSVEFDKGEIIDVTRDDAIITITGLGMAGAATVIVTANDGNGGVISDEFLITVEARINMAPSVIQTIPDMVLIEGFAQVQIDLDTVFTDDFTDRLVYAATVDPSDVVQFDVADHILTILEGNPGTATVIISADDLEGGVAETSFMTTVDQVLSTQQQVETLRVYPNPVHDHLNVIAADRPVLLTLTGRRLHSAIQRTDMGWQINLSDIAPGVYLLIVDGTSHRILKTDN